MYFSHAFPLYYVPPVSYPMHFCIYSFRHISLLTTVMPCVSNVQCIFKFAIHPFCLTFDMYAVYQGVICSVLASKQHPMYMCLYFICIVLIIDLSIHKMHLCKLPKYANPAVCCIVFPNVPEYYRTPESIA